MIILNVLLLLSLIIFCVTLAIRQHRDQEKIERITRSYRLVVQKIDDHYEWLSELEDLKGLLRDNRLFVLLAAC